MAARNWDRERREWPLRRRVEEPELTHPRGRPVPREGGDSVSFAAIAVLVGALEPRIRRELARTACGGVLELATQSPNHASIGAGTTMTREAELEWMLSTGRVLTTGVEIGERADALAATKPEYRLQLEWLARTVRRHAPAMPSASNSPLSPGARPACEATDPIDELANDSVGSSVESVGLRAGFHRRP
jgi:hypothetical protein